jgi:hypothetical protein
VDSDKWQRAKELFGSALDHEPAERSAFLTQACGGDDALRQEVEALLAAHEEAGTTIADPRGRDSLSGRRLGSYQLMHRIGQGGMAMVYLAARADEKFRKCVAIKLILPGLHTEDLLRRFRNERQTLAALDHPNIVFWDHSDGYSNNCGRALLAEVALRAAEGFGAPLGAHSIRRHARCNSGDALGPLVN